MSRPTETPAHVEPTEANRPNVGIVFGFALLGILLGVGSAVWIMLTPPSPTSFLSPSMRGVCVAVAFVGVPAPVIALGYFLGRRAGARKGRAKLRAVHSDEAP